MNSGSFFRLDLDTSKVVEGITFYDYLDVPDLRNGKDSIKYPIRVAISSERVSFFVHYFDEYVTTSISDNKRIEELLRPHHAEETIISLDYHSGLDCKDNLSAHIKHIYNSAFPLSNYLHDLLTERYIVSGGRYKFIQDSQINEDSYSSLYIWGLLKKEGLKNRYDILGENDEITKFLRKLLLDFMFDLMHSDVFESSKYYTAMRDGLMADFFFSSIVKKSEYYYYRRLVRNKLNKEFVPLNELSLKDVKQNIAILGKVVRRIRRENRKRKINVWWNQLCKPNDSEVIKRINKKYERKVEDISKDSRYTTAYDSIESIKNLYAEKLDESEADWIEVIMGPLADRHFSFTPEWYEEQIPRKKKKRFSVSESWFVNPEEEMSRVFFPLSDDDSTLHYLNSYELGALLGTGNLSSVLKRNTAVSKWFYRRFDFSDTFRIHLFKNWNEVFALTLLVFAIVALIPGLGFWECPRNIALFPGVAAIGLFLTSAVFGFRICYLKDRIEKIDNVLVINRCSREHMKAFRLSLLCGAIWAFLYCFNLPDSSCWRFLVGKIAAVIVIAVLSLFAVRPRAHIIDNIHLLLPRLVASITAAWSVIVIGNDLVKEHLSWPICAILSVIVYVFILYEGNKSLPNITARPRLWRAFELMLISFSISLIIGIFAVNILSLSLIHI